MLSAWIARNRVRMGYPLAVAVLWFARPNRTTIAIGALVGAVGLLVRAYAAGVLHKQEQLTMSGPYAYTRNPLYLGSAILAGGAAVAMHSWISAAILLIYFGLVYYVVMRREEGELRGHHGAAFEEYARRVPLFMPGLRLVSGGARSSGEETRFTVAQYKKNHEWEAALGFCLLLLALLLIWKMRMPT